MDLKWNFIFSNAWPIFWMTTLYSYVACFFVGFRTAVIAKGDKSNINEEIEKFIISPFYVATFFSLFSVLFYKYGSILKHNVMNNVFLNILAIGFVVFFGHLLIEVMESAFIRKNPLRILEDRDAIRLSGIYLLIIALIAVII